MADRRAPGRPRRTAEASAEARKRLLNEARRLFVQEGFAGVSIRRITAEAGMAPMSFYLHFASKRAILWHIIIDIFAANFDACDAAMARAQGALGKLHAFGHAFVAYWLDNPDHFRVVYLNEATETAEDRTVYGEASRPLAERVAALATLFENGAGSGELRGGDARARSQAYLSLLHGVALSLVTIPEYPWSAPEAVAREAIETFLAGAAAPSAWR